MPMRALDYHDAAWDRINDALFLHTNGYFGLAMYASGVAVECMLRAFRLLRDTSFDERHDLWELWQNTSLADFQTKPYFEKIHSSLGVVVSLWRNDFRFRSEDALRSVLRRMKANRGIKGDFLKYNSKKLYEAAREIIQIGAEQWQQFNKK